MDIKVKVIVEVDGEREEKSTYVRRGIVTEPAVWDLNADVRQGFEATSRWLADRVTDDGA